MEQRVFVTQMAFESSMVGLGKKIGTQKAFKVPRMGRMYVPTVTLCPSLGYVPILCPLPGIFSFESGIRHPY